MWWLLWLGWLLLGWWRLLGSAWSRLPLLLRWWRLLSRLADAMLLLMDGRWRLLLGSCRNWLPGGSGLPRLRGLHAHGLWARWHGGSLLLTLGRLWARLPLGGLRLAG